MSKVWSLGKSGYQSMFMCLRCWARVIDCPLGRWWGFWFLGRWRRWFSGLYPLSHRRAKKASDSSSDFITTHRELKSFVMFRIVDEAKCFSWNLALHCLLFLMCILDLRRENEWRKPKEPMLHWLKGLQHSSWWSKITRENLIDFFRAKVTYLSAILWGFCILLKSTWVVICSWTTLQVSTSRKKHGNSQ